ncbi:hypothetical protein ACFLSA_06095, partial [Bacteroidota bacterium]
IFQKKITLKPYYVANSSGEVEEFKAVPGFVFADSKGNEINVITKVYESPLQYKWSIQTVIIE